MSFIADVRAALEQRLDSLPGGKPAGGISWENVSFDPPDGQPWLRSILSPTSNRPTNLGTTIVNNHLGLHLITVFTPENKGPSESDDLADRIRAHFPPGLIITQGVAKVRIRYAERGQSLSDPPWTQVPVTIGWLAFEETTVP